MLETLPLHHFARVSSLLARGEIVAYPTGTAYALGTNALDAAALERLSSLKQRESKKAYSVLLPARDPDRFVQWTDEEQRAFERLRDRPLTLLVRPTEVSKHLAVEGRIGIRTPDHPFTRELVSVLSVPVTVTSANLSGQPPASTLTDLEPLAAKSRLFAVDAGSLSRLLPSTVARLDGDGWHLARKGDVTLAELKSTTAT